MEIETLTEQLIKYTKEIERLTKEVENIKEKLKQLTVPGWSVTLDGYTVKHVSIKRTITDLNELQKLGYDLNRITVTITKIDPSLVRTIGEKENKPYYTIENRIVMVKNENKN